MRRLRLAVLLSMAVVDGVAPLPFRTLRFSRPFEELPSATTKVIPTGCAPACNRLGNGDLSTRLRDVKWRAELGMIQHYSSVETRLTFQLPISAKMVPTLRFQLRLCSGRNGRDYAIADVGRMARRRGFKPRLILVRDQSDYSVAERRVNWGG